MERPMFFLGFTTSPPLFVIVVKPLKANMARAMPAIKPVGEAASLGAAWVNSNVNPDAQRIVREKISIPPIFNIAVIEDIAPIILLPAMLTINAKMIRLIASIGTSTESRPTLNNWSV